ncbi:transposase [Corynebacterium belfantii]|uniref:transposase n=1 Tax=Corynebacterium belfantii TaxID=2014537 RepID=UPI002E19CB52|nr:transposase [Corynebacterium belfantii]
MPNAFRQELLWHGAQDAVADPYRRCFIRYSKPDSESVWSQAREVVAFCENKFPCVASYLEEALDELLAFTNAPKSVWKKVWSNNPY